MTKTALALLTILALGCTHKTVGRNTASTSTLYFECALKNEPTSGVRIVVNAAEFQDVARDVPASIEILKKGKVVQSASNALLGERMPPTPGDDVQPIWALNADLGRSGKVFMGYDAVNSSWSMNVSTMGFSTDPKGEPADCSVIDSSGMGR